MRKPEPFIQSLQATLHLVCDLLAQLPGVKVLHSEIDCHHASIVVKSTGSQAIETLQYMTFTANVSIKPWLSAPEPDVEVEQHILAKCYPDAMKFGELQILGIYLVWRLHKMQIMNSADANALLLE